MTASTATASVAVDAQVEIDGSAYCFARFRDQSTQERVQNHRGTICGKAHPPSHRVQAGREIIEFSLTLDITAPVMTTLLPHMTTTNSSGVIWAANETLSSFDIVVNKVGRIHTYTNCRIARWVIRAQRGSMPVSIQLDCVAESETETASYSFTDGDVDQIYAFTGVSYEIDDVAVPVDRLAIMSDMNIFKQWNNSTTLTDAILTLQNTYLATSIPYVATTKDQYWGNRATATPRKQEVTFVSGEDTLKFEMPAGILNPKSPDITDKLSEIRLPLTWQAHVDTSTDPDTAAFKFEHTDGA